MPIDKYANIATIGVTQSAANTLTYAELRTQVGIDSDRKSASALIIDEIDYMIANAAVEEMTAANDRIDFGLTISNAVANMATITDRRILHAGYILRHDQGTAASAWMTRMPIVAQFFPPIPTAERSLFLGMGSNGLATAGVLTCRIYYRIVQLTQGEFLELAEVFRLVG